MKIVIIGAGLAGLSVGAKAASEGHEVIIYEKNSVPGGVCALCEVGDYKFEQGPLLIGDMLEGEPIYEFLSSLGIKLETMRADRDSAFLDFKIIRPKEYLGPYWRRDYLKTIFPEDSDGLDRYYKFYDNVMHLRFLFTLKDSLYKKLSIMYTFLKIKKYTKMNADELTKYFFKNEKLRLVYTGILADFCAEPKEAEGLATVFTNFETAFDERIPLYRNGVKYYPGFSYIKGGVQKLPESLAEYITNHNGKIYYNTIVDKVLINDGKVTGVRLSSGEVVNAEMVFGCGSGKDFFYKTVGEEYLTFEYKKILNEYRPMEGVFMLHLGVDYNPLDYLRSPLIYCYRMYDLSKATENLRNGIYHEGDDGFLIFVPSYHASEFAPLGHHALTLYTVAPDKLKDYSWEEKKEEYAQKLIKLAEEYLPDLHSHIKEMKIMTPVEYRHLTHMTKSSFGGNVPIKGQITPYHVTPVKDLYFIGQQSQNGGGMQAVISGALDAYKKAMKNK